MEFKSNLKSKYLVFTSLVLVMFILGSLFGVSFSYNKGDFSYTQECYIPYTLPKVYYSGSTLIENNDISGSISAAGVVSVTIGETTITEDNGTLTLPLSIKNDGNVDGYLYELYISILFYEDDELTSDNNAIDASNYYLTFVPNTGYTLLFNYQFGFSNISLTSDEANASQFLTSITIDDNITTSDLCGKDFIINILVELVQEGYEELE